MSGYFNDRTPRSSFVDASVRKPRRVALQTSPQRQSEKRFGPWEAYAGEEERYSQQPSRDPPVPSNTYWVNGDRSKGISVSPRRQPYLNQDVFALEEAHQHAIHQQPPSTQTAGYVKSPVHASLARQQPVANDYAYTHQLVQPTDYVPSHQTAQPSSQINSYLPPPPPPAEHAAPYVLPVAAAATSPHLPLSIPLVSQPPHQSDSSGLSHVDVIPKVNPDNPTLLRLKLKGNIQKLPIKAVKQSLESCTGVPADRQILEKEGFYLSDELTASAVGMVSGSVLTLSLAAPGQLVQMVDPLAVAAGDVGSHISGVPELIPPGSSRMFYYTAPHHQNRAISPHRH